MLAIDIGTVTCRLLVCKFERGVQQELVRECRIVNLGIGVSKTGILQEDAIERVVSCVKEYCELVRAIAQKEEVPSIPIGAVATSASRDARNACELVSRLHELGVDLLIIPGEVEADLSFRGASAEFPGERLVVVDVGGGSTEVIFGSAQEGVLVLAFVQYRVPSHNRDVPCFRPSSNRRVGECKKVHNIRIAFSIGHKVRRILPGSSCRGGWYGN